MSVEYNLKGALTFDEYLECHKILAAKRRLWIRGIIALYGGGTVIFGVFFSASKPDPVVAIIGSVCLLYAIFISPIQFRYRVKRNWDRYPRIRKGFDITVLPDGIQTTDDKGNPSHSSWDSFEKLGESESLFLLYYSPLLPLCLPKRLVLDEDIDPLREALSSSIG